MRSSSYLLATLRETPAEAELISHQLMLRAGLIRKLASGLYSWLPTGLRVLQKIEAIVRDELNAAGAIEILMPSIQPAELWEESGRWDKYGSLLLRLSDRHQRNFCYGPTHEEVVTDIVRREIRSYKQLPLNFYQIQTKFRDEIRPRFGVMRAREFIMKDAYSFHMNSESLQETYQKMYQAYCNIFTRLGLQFRPVLADSGEIGGEFSHEFQVLAESGEDLIFYSDQSDYAANIERAEALPPQHPAPTATAELEKIATPNQFTIEAVCQFLGCSPKQSLKTLLVKGSEQSLVALLLRGDHELNEIKAAKLPQVASPLEFAEDEQILKHIHCKPGSIGPINLTIPMIADRSVSNMSDFCCGANEDGFHYQHVNWGRDLPLPETADLRNVQVGDASPDGKGTLKQARGIEVGHIFQLGTKYSAPMNATVLNEQGKSVAMSMGCFGIGISRIVAAAIEQNHDAKGILWPLPLAPFQVALIPINMHKSHRVRELSERLYQQLQQLGYDVLFDDRKERPGVLFADMDLLGIPHHIIVGEKGIDTNHVEYKNRQTANIEKWDIDEVLTKLQNVLTA